MHFHDEEDEPCEENHDEEVTENTAAVRNQRKIGLDQSRMLQKKLARQFVTAKI